MLILIQNDQFENNYYYSGMKHLLSQSEVSMRLSLKRQMIEHFREIYNYYNFNYTSLPIYLTLLVLLSVIDCGQPQANQGSSFSGNSFTVHSTVDYKCDPGFKEISGSTQRTCGLDGLWTGQPISCKCKYHEPTSK